MSFKLTVDKSVWKKMKSEFAKASQYEVNAGAFEDAKYGPDNDNLQVAQVWQWQEEGVPAQNIPTRPAIRVGFMLPIQKGSYDKYFVESMSRIAQGKSTFKQEYELLAQRTEKDLKKAVADWSTPPNAPYTVAEKGFNDPLIDTGLLYSSIEARVEKKGAN
jgi:hypothetical protein